ncbi:MAG: DUF5060 domain-containing protein, partial [Myxococcales bacterium]|nr:DUF5060 domain-containing protein [Myxococcales bacterium]
MRATLVSGLLRAASLLAAAACSSHALLPRAPGAAFPAGQLRARAPVDTRHEITFDAATDGLPADDLTIDARFTTPSGKVVEVGGFASRGHFKVRYTPREPGLHTWTIRAGEGRRLVGRGELEAVPGGRHGFVRIDPRARHRLVADDGTTRFVLGENRFDVYDPRSNHESADIRSYVERMAAYGMSTIRVFIVAGCAPEPGTARYRIGCLEPAPGRFDERTAEAIDTLFDAAESANVDVVLVAFALGFTSGPEGRRSWDDNPYSAARGGPARSPKDFFRAPALRTRAIRKLRYIADRWASSPRLLAVDLLDEPERDGAIGEQVWIPWAEEMSRAWRASDPYAHLVTAGPVGLHWNVEGDDGPWYASAANDLVQWHLDGREVHDAHALADAMTHKVAETWEHEKPVFCGQFAYGGEDGATYDHTHVGLWSLAMSGAGALARSAPPRDVEWDEPMTAARARHFEVLSGFLRSLDPTRAYSARTDVRVL